jgi:hypothetical protein
VTNIHSTLAKLRVPIGPLVPYGKNPRRGNVDLIVESLEHHGQYRPIVVRAGTNEVLAGNHTLAAAKELGWKEIAAPFGPVADDQAARIVLVDNRASDDSTYDKDVLAEVLDALPDLEGTGYDDADLARLIGEAIGGEMGDVAEPDRDNGDGETVNLTRLQCGELNISLAADEYNMLRSYWRAWLDLHGTDYGLIRGLVEHAPKI